MVAYLNHVYENLLTVMVQKRVLQKFLSCFLYLFFSSSIQEFIPVFLQDSKIPLQIMSQIFLGIPSGISLETHPAILSRIYLEIPSKIPLKISSGIPSVFSRYSCINPSWDSSSDSFNNLCYNQSRVVSDIAPRLLLEFPAGYYKALLIDSFKDYSKIPFRISIELFLGFPPGFMPGFYLGIHH